jgi:hypothetical protein
MTTFRKVLAGALTVALTSSVATQASQDNPKPISAPDMSGAHDFDTRVGKWKVKHCRLKERLAGSTEWEKFEGTQTAWSLLGGLANVDENVFHMPSGTYSGVTLRAYDPKTGQWAIWWLDGRNPFGSLEPPVKGRFENGVGTFYSDDTLRGKPIRVRFVWSNMTQSTGHWEQAFSPDGGKTWETNWITDFTRAEDEAK